MDTAASKAAKSRCSSQLCRNRFSALFRWLGRSRRHTLVSGREGSSYQVCIFLLTFGAKVQVIRIRRIRVLAETRQALGNLTVFQQSHPCVRVDSPRTP